MNFKRISLRSFFLFIAIFFAFLSWNLKFFSLFLISILFFLFFINQFLNKKKVLLILCSILITLIIIEILIPYLPSKNKNIYAYFDESSTYNNSNYRDIIDGMGFVPKKGSFKSKKISAETNETIYDVMYNIGNDNFRENLFTGKANVHLFGGSIAFGEGLNENETLSYYLWDNHNLKTKNFGVHGYGVHQALFLIDNLDKSALNGVNILLTGPLHIRRSACKVSYAYGTPIYKSENGYAVYNGICIFRKNIFTKIFNKSNISKIYYKAFIKYGKTNDKDLEQYLSIVRSIKKKTNENNSKLVIAYLSAKDSYFNNTSFNNKELFDNLSKISDKIIDVTLADNLSALDQKYIIHKLDRHPSALANQERADKLGPVIKEILKR